MTVQWSPEVRNAVVAGWESAIGVTPRVELRTGAKAALTTDAAAGTLLAVFTLAADWASAPTAGTVTLTGLPVIVDASAPGVIGHYRITNAAGTVCHEQGTVTATGEGGDLTVDNVNVVAGQSVMITSWSKTAPGA